MSGRQIESRLPHPAYRGVRLSDADVAAGWRLSTEAGWNQTEADWRFMLSAGEGFGFEDAAGALVASAVIVPYESRFAWISMVLVTAAARRQGLATLLLRRALVWSAERRCPLLLDATAAGRAVYTGLGFKDLRGLTRWSGAGESRPDSPAHPIGSDAELEPWAEWDRPQFGASRLPLLRALRQGRPDLALQVSAPGSGESGYCLGRSGRVATQIGPLAAESEITALALLRAALERISGLVFLDLMDGHPALERELTGRGFSAQRSFVRMGFGSGPLPTKTSKLFAAAGPEFG